MMAPLRSLVAATLLFLSTANAHFELTLPESLEGDKMNESLEPNAPCGGGVADLSQNTATDFHVDGDSVSVLLGHPQADFLIRATLDSRAAGNWSQLYPIFTQSGRGNFCTSTVKAPKEWVGKKGIIGIACNAPDGLLYQCAAVNFVAGANTTPGSACTNGSSVSASFNDVPALASLVGTSTSTNTSSSSTTPSPSASTSKGAAAALLAPGHGVPLGSLAVTAAMVLVGAALL